MEEEKNDAYQPRKYRWIATAGAVIVILLGWIFLYPQEPDYKALFAAYFEPYPDVITEEVKNEPGELAGDIRNAFRHYNNSDFREAAIAFGQIYQETEEDFAYFYQSVSLMADGNTEQAVNNLEAHNWSEPENYRTVTQWYIALGYIKLKEKEKAVDYLKKVAASEKPISQQAEELLTYF